MGNNMGKKMEESSLDEWNLSQKKPASYNSKKKKRGGLLG